MSQACGKDVTAVDKDTKRIKYLSPEEAIDYGLIDKVRVRHNNRNNERYNEIRT